MFQFNPDGSIKTNTFTINFSGDESGGTGPGAPDPSLVGPVVVGSETVNGLTGDDGTAVEENDGLAGGDDTRIITDSELAFELRTAGGGGNSIAVPAEETIYRLTQLPGNGTLQLDDIAAAIKPDDIHFPKTKLVCLENTHAGMPLPHYYPQEINQV